MPADLCGFHNKNMYIVFWFFFFLFVELLIVAGKSPEL